jgi:leucyl aminopeptidase
MDMTAYVKPGTQERIGIIQDFVSPSLTEFVHRLIDEYNDIPSVQTACKYACSDHSSWTKIGVPSAFAIGKLGLHT